MGSKTEQAAVEKNHLHSKWTYVVCAPGSCSLMDKLEKKYRENPTTYKEVPSYCAEPLIFHIHLVFGNLVVIIRLSSKAAAKNLLHMLVSVWSCVEKGIYPVKKNEELSAVLKLAVDMLELDIDRIPDLAS